MWEGGGPFVDGVTPPPNHLGVVFRVRPLPACDRPCAGEPSAARCGEDREGTPCVQEAWWYALSKRKRMRGGESVL